MVIRTAEANDASDIAEIYAPYVLSHSSTFEVTPPGVEVIRQRITEVLDNNLPYLVAEDSGVVVGFCYAVPYRARPAYASTIETSIYVGRDHHRKGAGQSLMEALMTKARQIGKQEIIAVVGDSANTASIELHKRLGFRVVGTLERVGFKFDRYIDTVILQKGLV
ncbi:MAG: N-acetyltransferase family protein [Pseudomonadota bacterium]